MRQQRTTAASIIRYGQHNSGPARTGAGVLSLMMAGERDSQECQNGLAYLQANPLNGTNDWPYRDHFFYADVLYVTQAMYQAGGAYWRSWYPNPKSPDRHAGLRRRLGAKQRLPPRPGRNTRPPCPSLVLQVPAGLLPDLPEIMTYEPQ